MSDDSNPISDWFKSTFSNWQKAVAEYKASLQNGSSEKSAEGDESVSAETPDVELE